MKRTGLALTLILILALSFVAGALLIKPAMAKTIIVPDDYSTIKDAINAATDGDTVFIKKGTYEEETLKIIKSLSIIGQDSGNTKINLHPPLVTTTIITQTFTSYAYPITIEANDVKLSGFTINSDGGDILSTGSRIQITGNIINTGIRLGGSYQTFSENNLTASLVCGGDHSDICSNNVVNGSIGCDSGSYNRVFANNVLGGGLGSGGTSSCNLIYGNTVKKGKGIWACYGDIVAKNTVTESEIGISIAWGFNNVICGNVITNNRGAGLTKLEGTDNIFYANYVANNTVGVEIGVISWQHTGNNTFYHNNFVHNIQQTKVINLDHTDYWDNGKEGNYWSNYTGSDANHNGLGDSPYIIFGERHTYDYPYTTYAESYEDRYPLMTPFDTSNITIELPKWATNQLPNPLSSLDIIPPLISVLSLENKTYPKGNLSLTFTASKPTSWIGFSLDGQKNVTVTGNTILLSLSEGSHYLTLYANDTAGITGASETVYFSIEAPFPTTLVITGAVIVILVGIGMLVYFKKRKH